MTSTEVESARHRARRQARHYEAEYRRTQKHVYLLLAMTECLENGLAIRRLTRQYLQCFGARIRHLAHDPPPTGPKLASAIMKAIADLQNNRGDGNDKSIPSPKPRVTFRGAWRDGVSYNENDGVLSNGKLFRCRAYYVNSSPDTDPVCWTPVGAEREPAA